MSAAERLYAWNTLEVLAISSGNIEKPANAIPGRAQAVLQLRFVVGTRADKVVRCGPGTSATERLSDGRGARRAKLCRVPNRFRQPLDQLDGRVRSGRPREKRPRFCRISAARCPTTCFPIRSACPRSGCRIPIPAAPSTRPMSIFCCRSPKRPLASWRVCSGIWARCTGRGLETRPIPAVRARRAAESYILFRSDLCKHC